MDTKTISPIELSTRFTPEFIEGAKACVAAIAGIPALVAADNTQPVAEYFSTRDEAIAFLLRCAGPLSPRAAGAMAVLAEFVAGQEQDAGYYSLNDLNSEMAMSADELSQSRQEFAAEVSADGVPQKPSNVIQLR